MGSKFLIIDGSSLVHRAFHALPPLVTKTGLHTNAVYGFTMMLVRLLADHRPDYLAVAFDRSRITFRTEMYTEYKAHRKETPGELSEQFPLVREVLQAFGVRTLEEAGYEADDIIGTLAAKASADNMAVFIVTGDRDALQLINDHTTVLLTRKGISDLESMDTQKLQEKYGVSPAQIIDLKGLMGDASDNIPGVPGIGEKTAGKLLAEFGSLDNVLANIDAISTRKVQNALREHSELAKLSQRLATIICDMPLPFAPEDYRFQPDLPLLGELFRKYEFRSLLSKLELLFANAGVTAAVALPAALELTPANVVADRDAVRRVVAELRQQGTFFCFPLILGAGAAAQLQGLAVAVKEAVYYLPVTVDGWQDVAALLADGAVKKHTYDAKRLFNVCQRLNLPVAGLDFDALLAAYLLDPAAANYPLAALAEKYLQQGHPPQEEDATSAYVCWVVRLLGELCPLLEEQLAERQLEKLFHDMELPLVEVLSAMEAAGIQVDREFLQRMSQEMAVRIDGLQAVICNLAGEEFNVNSPKQLGVILFDKLQLPVMKKTKTGYSTDAEVLEKLAGQHDIVDKILEYRLLAKLKSTYLDGLDALVGADNGRIHTSFNQTITTTGRLSSSEPNLQNIPIRTEVGRKIRELFVPGPGYDWMLSADYSQIELRVLAHMSGDLRMIDAFRQGQDIHASTASEVFGTPLAAVTPEMRSRAKAVNFGIVYGISDYGLSRDTGVSRKEAASYIESYFSRYAGVKEYIDRSVADARRQGYVVTLFGRRRYLPEINSSNFNLRSFAERMAMNTPIQGTAADIIKIAMIRVYHRLVAGKLRSRLLLQVHDELVIETVAAELEEVKALLKEEMENAVVLDAALVVDVKAGANWARAK